MRRKRFKTEEIIQKLREAEVLLSQGRNVSAACRQIGVTDNTYHPGNSERHPLNSADGSMVRHTKRYTLTHRVATATTLITIRVIPRHGKVKSSDFRLLAQFGLTPKSRRGMAAGDELWNWSRLMGRVTHTCVTQRHPESPSNAAEQRRYVRSRTSRRDGLRRSDPPERVLSAIFGSSRHRRTRPFHGTRCIAWQTPAIRPSQIEA